MISDLSGLPGAIPPSLYSAANPSLPAKEGLIFGQPSADGALGGAHRSSALLPSPPLLQGTGGTSRDHSRGPPRAGRRATLCRHSLGPESRRSAGEAAARVHLRTSLGWRVGCRDGGQMPSAA